MRRALTHVGGPTHVHGDPRVASWLADAMSAAEHEDPDVLTHGFHPWPARMHRSIARVAIANACGEGARVLDPFAGSGTVLLEAQLAGHTPVGVDLNPLSAPLCRVKSDPGDRSDRKRFLESSIAVAEASIERVRDRVRVMAKLPPSMLNFYGTHTLKELAGLLLEIRAVESTRDRVAMEMVFSSLVVKVSNKRAETSEEQDRKRVRKGLVTEFFVRKCEELAMRWADLANALPEDAVLPRVFEGDATHLRGVLGAHFRANLILSSPPYGGTYDYHAQHALRLAWLGLDARHFAASELGARRDASRANNARIANEQWNDQVRRMLIAMKSVLAPDGAIVLLMGDARFGSEVAPLLPQLRTLAPEVGLAAIAAASQPRPGWGAAPREEHLVLLARIQ